MTSGLVPGDQKLNTNDLPGASDDKQTSSVKVMVAATCHYSPNGATTIRVVSARSETWVQTINEMYKKILVIYRETLRTVWWLNLQNQLSERDILTQKVYVITNQAAMRAET